MSAPMIATTSREAIAEEMRDLRAEANRLPVHHQRRVKIERRMSELTDDWLAADG